MVWEGATTVALAAAAVAHVGIPTIDGEHVPTTVMKWGGLRGLSSLCCRWVSRWDSLIRYVPTIIEA